MNEDKVLDFSQVYRKKHGQAPPNEGERLKDSIMDRLSQIPPKLANEFAEGIKNKLEEQLIFRSIIVSCDSPNLVKHLIDKLSQTQLERLKEIIVNLIIFTGQKSLDKIANVFLDATEATPGSILKAGRLFSLIEKMPEQKVAYILEGIRLVGVMSSILTVYRMEDVRPHVENRLSKMPEEELDNLISLAVRL